MADNIDFGKTASDYAQHREGFPRTLLSRLQSYAIGLSGQSILDIGTGTGTLARQFALQGSRVSALDVASELIEQAKLLDRLVGAEVDYHLGNAEALPFADCSMDVISAGQCWHWFNAELVARECHRVLKPGGALVICHFDWLPIVGNMVELTESLILKHNSNWSMGGGSGLYPRWLSDLSTEGFQHLETFSFDLDVPYSHERWCGRIRASAGISASLSPLQVHNFDKEHQATLASRFPDEPLQIPHRVWSLIARKTWS
ncbi:class I SAM-dependent methyltransferase [Vibrio barjaei]|uniref:Class I SAM-dependent methyltransferase n=1 Tax=Vibrio barjaei TaxID=1676683 RepID=A0ABW7IF56_9VIBR|nr:class I SAM-dependent methyltransferase [Vibrio barjaei]MCY9871321.1 class I SAM-dependent methyltransferase [Vibrio barjaei]